MSAFAIHSIILIISGIISVILTARIARTHKKTSYALMLIIPLFALILSLSLFSPIPASSDVEETKFEDLPPEVQKEVQKYIDNMNLEMQEQGMNIDNTIPNR